MSTEIRSTEMFGDEEALAVPTVDRPWDYLPAEFTGHTSFVVLVTSSEDTAGEWHRTHESIAREAEADSDIWAGRTKKFQTLDAFIEDLDDDE